MLRKTLPTPRRTIRLAKALRKRETTPEKILWQKLRKSRLRGFKFRRQAPLGPFIVDFLCLEARLIIEVDGDYHWLPERKIYDRKRERWLESRGFQVLRFGNLDVKENLDSVLDHIGVVLVSSETRPTP